MPCRVESSRRAFPFACSAVLPKRNYTHIQEFLAEIEEMIAGEKSQREVAEHFGFKDKTC